MVNEQNKQKQSGDEDAATQQVKEDNFTADELGQASIYDDPTMIAQQMRRGNESKGDPDNRDVVGTTKFEDTEEGRTDQVTTPHHKRTDV